MKNIYLLLLLIPFAANAQVFVDKDATGANDGTTWENAYTDLQVAINAAPISAEIWVAEGVYHPSSTGQIDTSFLLFQSVHLYGGFEGTETMISERVIGNNPTILSGDLNNDDDIIIGSNPINITFNNRADNSERVLVAFEIIGELTIDGITVSGGNSPSSAAGLFVSADDTLDALVKNCIIENNRATTSGGGMVALASSSEILDIRIENTVIRQNLVVGSSLPKGGGLFVGGGGIVNINGDGVHFHQNISGSRGGAINYESFSAPVMENCIFSENLGTNGGVTFELQPTPSVYRNCTFHKNEASTASVLFRFAGSAGNVKIENCIFYDNGPNPFASASTSAFDISNSAIEYASWTAYSSVNGSNSNDLGNNLFNINPTFVDELNYNYNLQANSPMIDAGNNAVLETMYDLTGYISRIVDGTVDIGALEYHLPFAASVVAGDTICNSSNTGMATLTSDNYPPFNYVWNDPTVVGGSQNSLTSGSYEVTVTNAIGDFEILNFEIFETTEILNNPVISNATAGNSDGSITTSISGGKAPYVYEWNTNPVQTAENLTNVASGSYILTVTGANGCSKVFTMEVSETVSIANINNNPAISYGPNPIHNWLYINSNSNLSANTRLTDVNIYNISGLKVYSGKMNSPSNTSLYLADLDAGIYIMELSGEEERYTARIVKL